MVRDVVAMPILYRDNEGGYVKVYDKTRWLIMAVINVIEVVLCFSVLALHYGTQFMPAIKDALSAIYFSSVTFMTLGYGDIAPLGPKAKALACWELLAFLVFIVVKLPLVVAVIRVKEDKNSY